MTQYQKLNIDKFLTEIKDFASVYGWENLVWVVQRLFDTGCVVHTFKYKDSNASTMHAVRTDAEKSYLQTSIDIFYRKNIIDELLIDL
jgi:hypothetical protein